MTIHIFPDYYLHKDPSRRFVQAALHVVVDGCPTTHAWHFAISVFNEEYTDQQRKTLFGLAYKYMMEHCGLRTTADKEALHRQMCCLYFGEVPVLIGHPRPVRTTTIDEHGRYNPIDKMQAARFFDFLVQTAAEYGCVIPDPDPEWRLRRAA